MAPRYRSLNQKQKIEGEMVDLIQPKIPSARELLLLSVDNDQQPPKDTGKVSSDEQPIDTNTQKLSSVQLGFDEVIPTKGPRLLLSTKRPFDEIESHPPPILLPSSPISFEAPQEKPAFQRFAHLIKQPKQTLPLPKPILNLISLFTALESILNYLKSRDTMAIFHKIQQSVQSQSGINFDLKHLAQIMYIYPEAYKLTSVVTIIKDQRVPSLSIEFVTDSIRQEFVAKLDKTAQSVHFGYRKEKDSKSMMSVVQEFVKQIPIRRQKFEESVLGFVKIQHQEFLKERGLTWEFDKVEPKWHPDFVLDEIAAIPEAELPIKKLNQEKKITGKKSASELLKELKEKKASRSSDTAILPPQSDSNQDGAKVKDAVDVNGDAPKEKISRSKALLERIREKERLRKAQEPKESPELLKEKSMMKRLGPIASSLHMFTKQKQKSVLAVPAAISHLAQSFPTYFFSNDQWFEHIQLLCKLVPDFCKLEVLLNCKGDDLKPEHYILKFLMGARMKMVNDTINNLIK